MMKTAEEKKLWKQFFEAEKQMFKFVQSHTEVLIEHNKPEYVLLEDEREVAPTYVRGIYRFKNKKIESQFIEILDDYKSRYKKVLGDKFKSYPIRTPEFYKDVKQINITINQAFESIKLIKNDWFRIYFTPAYPKILDKAMLDIQEVMKDFENIGIRSQMGILKTGLTVDISTDDLFRYCQTDNIQARRASGSQYRALLRHDGEFNGKRIKYGFILVDTESICSVYTSIPEATRRHSLAHVGNKISLDAVGRPLLYQLYDK